VTFNPFSPQIIRVVDPAVENEGSVDEDGRTLTKLFLVAKLSLEMRRRGGRMQFGAFIGPRADDIAGVRGRVLAAERAGFDFVSIQDHPYVPAYLDTFSLIANLTAATSTLRFITNVANLPLRPAPMLAKAAASIDRLRRRELS
jgi:hypothetical protein